MKRITNIIYPLIIIIFMGYTGICQEDKGKYEYDEVPEQLKFYKEKYEEVFDRDFQIVWKASKKAFEDIGCLTVLDKVAPQDNGLYKGTLKSDYCVIAQGDDSTFFTMKKYSYEVPLIRGGSWLNFRIQYHIIIKEQEDGKVHLLLKSEASGFEDDVTHEVHFWKSNGVKETEFLALIRKNVVEWKE